MGILQRLFGASTRSESGQVENSTSIPSSPDVPKSFHADLESSSSGAPDLAQLTGTTTLSRDAILALASRHGLTSSGYLEIAGFLQREVANEADPMAIAVHVEGERIGYLPGHLPLRQELNESDAIPVEIQIFTEMVPKGLRAEAWAWLGDGRPRWEWSATNRPPLSPQAKAQSQHTDTTEMVRDALAEGGVRASQFKAGMVNGVHYLELVEPIKHLKREGRLNEALELCQAAIVGAEGGRGGSEPAPWYTEQAAIIHRKLGQHDEEIAVLERWLKVCPADRRDGSRIAARLAKINS